MVPALGNSWHHCVSTRLVLEHFTTHRTLTITKSPIAAQHTARLSLTAAGLVETDHSGGPLRRQAKWQRSIQPHQHQHQ